MPDRKEQPPPDNMAGPPETNLGQPAGKSIVKLIGKAINEFEYIVGAAALLGLVALLTLSIFARYIGGASLPWSEELARFMFITVIFSTISYAAREHRHVRVTLFVERFFSRRVRSYVFSVGDLIWLGLNGVVLYGAYEIMAEMIRWPYSSPVLNLPMYYVYAVIPVFFVTLSIRIIQGIVLRHSGTDIDSHMEETV